MTLHYYFLLFLLSLWICLFSDLLMSFSYSCSSCILIRCHMMHASVVMSSDVVILTNMSPILAHLYILYMYIYTDTPAGM